MKKRLAFGLFLLLFGLSGSLFSQSRTAQKLINLDQKRFAAMVNRDFDFLRKVLADDLTYTHSNGKFETKAEFLTEIIDGTLRYQKMEPGDQLVRIYGKMAVITGRCEVSVKQDERVVESKLRYTDVWRKRRGKWQLVAWQSARIQ